MAENRAHVCLQQLTARLPSPHAFSTMTENIDNSVSAIGLIKGMLRSPACPIHSDLHIHRHTFVDDHTGDGYPRSIGLPSK